MADADGGDSSKRLQRVTVAAEGTDNIEDISPPSSPVQHISSFRTTSNAERPRAAVGFTDTAEQESPQSTPARQSRTASFRKDEAGRRRSTVFGEGGSFSMRKSTSPEAVSPSRRRTSVFAEGGSFSRRKSTVRISKETIGQEQQPSALPLATSMEETEEQRRARVAWIAAARDNRAQWEARTYLFLAAGHARMPRAGRPGTPLAQIFGLQHVLEASRLESMSPRPRASANGHANGHGPQGAPAAARGGAARRVSSSERLDELQSLAEPADTSISRPHRQTSRNSLAGVRGLLWASRSRYSVRSSSTRASDVEPQVEADDTPVVPFEGG